MDNILKLEQYSTSPQCWKNFILYVQSIADPASWANSEGGEGSYSYELIAEILTHEHDCYIVIHKKGGADIIFPSSKHKLLFELKYA